MYIFSGKNVLPPKLTELLRLWKYFIMHPYVQVTVQRLQHFDPVHEPHLRAVWTWMWLMLTAGVLNFAVCVVCFFVFMHLAHLGWTILSNQACIIIMRLLSGFYESRIHAAVSKIKADQHKVRMAPKEQFLS